MVSRRPCKKLDTPALSQWLWLYWPNVLHEWAVRAPDVSLWGFMQYGHGGKLLEFEGWWRQAHKPCWREQMTKRKEATSLSVYSDGFEAYDNDLTEADCPYEDAILRRMWLDGWERAKEEWEDDDEVGWENKMKMQCDCGCEWDTLGCYPIPPAPVLCPDCKEPIYVLLCPHCGESMVRANYQNNEGDWIACWLCGCAPTEGPSLSVDGEPETRPQ